jgi:hypothetical protein
LSQLNLFGLFSYSHPSGKSTCQFQGNYALVGDAGREVVWTLFTYGGCNKGGSSVVSAPTVLDTEISVFSVFFGMSKFWHSKILAHRYFGDTLDF